MYHSLAVSQRIINNFRDIERDKTMDKVIKDTEKEVYFKGGQRSVVNHLINQKQIQEE